MIRDFFRSRNGRLKSKLSSKRILRAEVLEPRTLLSATMPGSETQPLATAAYLATASVTATANHAPTVAQAAAAASNPVTGKTVLFSVLGTDDGGEKNLKYAWTAISIPSGAQAPTFSANGTNAAKATTVTFKTAGSYTFKATILDASNLTVTSTVTLTVNQTTSSITVLPAITNISAGATQAFTAKGYDQFGNVMKTQPAFAWSTTLGSITTPGGVLTAPATGGIGTVTATVGLIKGTASIRVIGNLGVFQAAACTPNPVTGTSAQLSVIGTNGADEGSLKYTWTTTARPNGAPAPTFSVNGTNAAKTSTVTFKAAGSYTFTASIVDTAGHTASSSVAVIVNSTVTRIVVTPGTTSVAAGGTIAFAAASYNQFGALITSQPTVTWTASAGAITSSGVYTAPPITATTTIRATAGTVSGTATVTDINKAPTIVASAVASSNIVTGASVQLSMLGADDAGEGNLTYTWAATTLPNGAFTPSFSANGTNAAKSTTVTFYEAGTYVFTATEADAGRLTATSSVTVVVNQTFTTVQIYAPSQVIYPGLSLQIYAWTLDQFYRVMTPPSPITWSASAGSITSNGLFYAFAPPGTVTITATSGSIQSSTTVNIISSTNFMGMNDAALATLTQSLFADGSIDRQDMISILQSVCPTGSNTLGLADYNDLKTILVNASGLNMPSYVRTLAGDVVNGNFANAWYQGQHLGNLTYLTTGANYTKLVDKWFYGTDYPVIDANVPAGQTYSYSLVSGSLFNAAAGGIPSHLDEFQGRLGDCYFITALGSMADSSPSAIQNMFRDNGDGTWTVRFFQSGIANYVTVDAMLPTDSGSTLVYADYGMMNNDPTNTLWIALAEKAYVQFNEIVQGGGYGTNCYSLIEGGIPGTVYNQVLGHAANYYDMSSQQALIDAVNNHLAAGICTNGTTDPMSGLAAGHAYAVIGYDGATGTFTLYNPWGNNQPGPLTWADLQANCWGFQTTDPSGTVAYGAIPLSGAKPRAPALTQIIFAAPFSAGPQNLLAEMPSQNPAASSSEPHSLANLAQGSYSMTDRTSTIRDRLFAASSIPGLGLLTPHHSWTDFDCFGRPNSTSRGSLHSAADDFFRELTLLEVNPPLLA
jgi:hypothetical protein